MKIIDSAFQLRPYQIELIQKVYAHWSKSKKKILLQLPTGGGKTCIFGAIAKEFALRSEKVLVLAHREELILQAANKMGAIANCPIGIIKSGYQLNLDAPIQVASVQTLVNRLSLLEDVGLVVIDEAHHSTAKTYRKILEAYPDAYQLGVTATPIRLDGTGFEEIFDELVTGVGVSQLIDDGYLSQYKLFAYPQPMNTKGIKKISGDFCTSELAKANDAVKLSGNLLRSYQTYASGKQCVVFAINVSHSRAIAERYNQAGISAIHLDGKTPATERQEALDRFRRREIKILTNCALFDEGLDIPALEAVQIAKPTESLSYWLQMVGRSLRSSPGKEHATIVDHTSNWEIHGLPSRNRIWTLEGVEENTKVRVRKDKKGRVNEVYPATKTSEIIESSVALQEICISKLDQWQQTFNDILRLQKAKNYKPGWMYHQLLELKPPLEIWQEYARLRGYKPGWAKYRFQDQEGA